MSALKKSSWPSQKFALSQKRSKYSPRSTKAPIDDIDASLCYIDVLFELNLDHILEKILMMLSLRDLDNCKAVNRRWNAFLKSNIWGRQSRWKTLFPKWKQRLNSNWRRAEPEIINRFNLSEQQSAYKKSQIEADAKDVVISIGNAAVFVWNRFSEAKRKIWPFEHSYIRGLNFESECPQIGLLPDFLLLAYPHEPSLKLFHRSDDYRLLQSLDLTDKPRFVKVFNENSFVLTFTNRADVYSIDADEKKLGLSRSIQGPNADITAVAVDEREVFLGSAENSTVNRYKVANGFQGEPIVTDQHCKPELMALRRPKLLVAPKTTARNLTQTQRTPLFAVYNVENGDLMWTLGMPDVYSGGPPPYHAVHRYNMRIDEDRIVVSMLTGTDITSKKPSVFVFMHALTVKGTETRGRDRGRVLVNYRGEFRRTKYPAIFLEKDSLFVGDENGREFLEKSYWKVKSKNRDNKRKDSLPRWQ